jgi:hypothetical protein
VSIFQSNQLKKKIGRYATYSIIALNISFWNRPISLEETETGLLLKKSIFLVAHTFSVTFYITLIYHNVEQCKGVFLCDLLIAQQTVFA